MFGLAAAAITAVTAASTEPAFAKHSNHMRRKKDSEACPMEN
jgi:hypothetical protein